MTITDVNIGDALAVFAFMAAQFADVWTTEAALKRGATEANGIMAWLMRAFGQAWIPIKLFSALVIAASLIAGGYDMALWAVAAVSAGIAAWNTRVAR